jgi:hypothetical protein
VVVAVCGFERAVGVVGLCDDSRPLAREAAEASKKPPRPRRASDQAEVVSEHDDRVERAERFVHVLDGEHARVANTPAAADLDRAGRRIDADDLDRFLLEVEGDAASAAACVEHASAYVAHRLPIGGFPLPIGGEEVVTGEDRHEAVVAFDDLERLLPFDKVLQQMAVGIVAAHAAEVAARTAWMFSSKTARSTRTRSYR